MMLLLLLMLIPYFPQLMISIIPYSYNVDESRYKSLHHPAVFGEVRSPECGYWWFLVFREIGFWVGYGYSW
ncbi:hypothetical protein BZA77DRAFT_317424 [Pyronema omphalodes]|nr:hypothetical protein BZA77DRAFT_317424 [Pyronema omphalodes]